MLNRSFVLDTRIHLEPQHQWAGTRLIGTRVAIACSRNGLAPQSQFPKQCKVDCRVGFSAGLILCGQRFIVAGYIKNTSATSIGVYFGFNVESG